MVRWISAHFGTGLIGAIAAYAAFFGLFWAIDTTAGEIAYLAVLLLLAAAPILIYQALALRHEISPRRWIGFTILSLLPAPALLLCGTYGLFQLLDLLFVGEKETVSIAAQVNSVYALTGFTVGMFWVAPMQWFAVRGAVPFRRWWPYAGMSLGLAAVVVVAVFICALILRPIWLALLPLAALVYAVGVYPAIRPFLGTSAAAA